MKETGFYLWHGLGQRDSLAFYKEKAKMEEKKQKAGYTTDVDADDITTTSYPYLV